MILKNSTEHRTDQKRLGEIFCFRENICENVCPRSVGVHATIEHCNSISLRSKKVGETVLACSYVAQVETFEQKNRDRQFRATISLKAKLV